jgi:hypothetical protein
MFCTSLTHFVLTYVFLLRETDSRSMYMTISLIRPWSQARQSWVERLEPFLILCLTLPQHWHGIMQHTTPWADGPAFVTQCPIVPGNSFLYEFDVPDQAGTFWYHSHVSVQYCDGLRGAFIVYDPQDPFASLYDYDDGMFMCISGV